MSCRLDVKEAILDNAMNKFIAGRFTFERVSMDTLEITNFGKAKNRRQAEAIARELVRRIANYYNGHVLGYVHDTSIYDPLRITLQVSPAYVEFGYRRLPSDQQTDPADKKSGTAEPIVSEDLPTVTPECK